MKNRFRFIPGLFTILNLFCGFLAVIEASKSNIDEACIFILYSAFFDIIDGISARFTGTSSRFGVELDSLADLVSFGVAPSFIFYKQFLYSFGGFGIALSSLPLIFTALRLARFNTQLVGFDKNYFTGVPAPLSAVTIATFFMFYFEKNFNAEISTVFAYLLIFLLPILMLSRLKYDTMPKFTLNEIKLHPVKIVFLFICLVLILISKGEGLFAFCLFYLSTGVIRWLYHFIKKNLFRKSREFPEEELKLKSSE